MGAAGAGLAAVVHPGHDREACTPTAVPMCPVTSLLRVHRGMHPSRRGPAMCRIIDILRRMNICIGMRRSRRGRAGSGSRRSPAVLTAAAVRAGGGRSRGGRRLRRGMDVPSPPSTIGAGIGRAGAGPRRTGGHGGWGARAGPAAGRARGTGGLGQGTGGTGTGSSSRGQGRASEAKVSEARREWVGKKESRRVEG
jgi:hypothetical protein